MKQRVKCFAKKGIKKTATLILGGIAITGTVLVASYVFSEVVYHPVKDNPLPKTTNSTLKSCFNTVVFNETVDGNYMVFGLYPSESSSMFSGIDKDVVANHIKMTSDGILASGDEGNNLYRYNPSCDIPKLKVMPFDNNKKTG